MAKYLDKVIKEMGGYSDMGMPDGETSMGMGSSNMSGADMGHRRAVKGYRMNDVLRRRTGGEQQEDTLDDVEERGGDFANEYDDEMSSGYDDGGMDSTGDVEEIKQFFMDNPRPSDEEIADYAAEHDMDMDAMRSAVYDLIQSLLADEEGSSMEDDYGDEEGNVSMDIDMGDEEGDSDFKSRSPEEEREIRFLSKLLNPSRRR